MLRCERIVFNLYSRCLGWIASGGITTSISASSSVRIINIFQLPIPKPTSKCSAKLATRISNSGRLSKRCMTVGEVCGDSIIRYLSKLVRCVLRGNHEFVQLSNGASCALRFRIVVLELTKISVHVSPYNVTPPYFTFLRLLSGRLSRCQRSFAQNSRAVRYCGVVTMGGT